MLDLSPNSVWTLFNLFYINDSTTGRNNKRMFDKYQVSFIDNIGNAYKTACKSMLTLFESTH